MMNLSRLPDHPAFHRLSENDKALLLRSAEIWEGSSGSRLYHPGDSGEDLLLIISGRLENSDRKDGEKRWLAGELWGEERLNQPDPLTRALTAADDSVWLRWSRRSLVSLLSASASLRKGLAPVKSDDGSLVSGLMVSIRGTGPVNGTGRSLRSSLRPLLGGLFLALAGAAGMALAGTILETLPLVTTLLPPALFVGWMLVFLFVRLLTEYGIDVDAITSRSFDWARFAVESRHVPIDRIQGVEVERNGLARRILGYGSVIVKTSALEGELLIKDVKTPDVLASEISALRDAGGRRSESRNRESMRRSLEESGLSDNVPRLLRAAAASGGKKAVDSELRFRKSQAVLLARLFLPILVCLIPILAADAITGMIGIPPGLIRLTTILPLFWGWYIFEDWRNDSFRVSGGYAVDLYRKPLGLKETRRQVDLASVQNIRTEQQGLFSVFFRFGDVIIVTAGGASDTVFKNVSRPWRVQEALFKAREEGLRLQAEKMTNERKDDLIRFAEAMDQIRGN